VRARLHGVHRCPPILPCAPCIAAGSCTGMLPQHAERVAIRGLAWVLRKGFWCDGAFALITLTHTGSDPCNKWPAQPAITCIGRRPCGCTDLVCLQLVCTSAQFSCRIKNIFASPFIQLLTRCTVGVLAGSRGPAQAGSGPSTLLPPSTRAPILFHKSMYAGQPNHLLCQDGCSPVCVPVSLTACAQLRESTTCDLCAASPHFGGSPLRGVCAGAFGGLVIA